MSATHHIDNAARLIITSWHGEPTDGELVDSLKNYHLILQEQPELADYNEIVDFSEIIGTKLSANGLIKLGELAAVSDKSTKYRRLAIVVNSTLAYGLARMYETYRGFNSSSHKEVQVFRNKEDALSWINQKISQAGYLQ